MSQALSVARELVKLSLSGDEADSLTNLRLQQLLYDAQAWSLVIRASELFSDELEAWRHGPVVPAVHSGEDGQGISHLDLKAFSGIPDLQGDEAKFVECVWDAYKRYSAIGLSEMTHEEAPWLKAWGDGPRNEPISVPGGSG